MDIIFNEFEDCIPRKSYGLGNDCKVLWLSL